MSEFRVRDFRDKGFFMLDDVYLNGYAKYLGTTASMVYISLCRHADKEQKSFPSQELIGEELGINSRVVMRKIASLEDWNIISKKRTRNKEGKWIYNTYYLLDKSEWRKPPTQNVQMDEPPTQKVPKPPTQNMYIKDTRNKETHNITKVIYKPAVYGNPDINLLMDHLREKMELPRLDLSAKTNRQYANILLKRSKKGVEGVKWLIDMASQDGWFKNHITSFKDLWNNQVKIVAGTRKGVKVDVTKRGIDATAILRRMGRDSGQKGIQP